MLTSKIHSIKRILNADNMDATDKINSIKHFLPDINDYQYIIRKELLLEIALESTFNKFRLIANLNESNNIFTWCNDEYNFVSMCNSKYKIDYSLTELPDVIDRAESWLKGYQEMCFHYNKVSLDIMGV